MGGRGHGGEGQGARDRSGRRRCRQAPRQRDLRPGQVGDGQALQPDRRPGIPSPQGRGRLAAATSRPKSGRLSSKAAPPSAHSKGTLFRLILVRPVGGRRLCTGVLGLGSMIWSSRRRGIPAAIASRGWAMVVRGGTEALAGALSSKPMTATWSGTVRPVSRRARRAPAAIRSLAAKTPSRSGNFRQELVHGGFAALLGEVAVGKRQAGLPVPRHRLAEAGQAVLRGGDVLGAGDGDDAAAAPRGTICRRRGQRRPRGRDRRS